MIDKRKLRLVPCDHFWLEVKSTSAGGIAICKYVGCQKRGEFSAEEWSLLADLERALNKPVRV